MAATEYPFTNLAFRAGGVKGIAYAGAIKAMEEKDITKNIVRLAGSSAGSITAVALAYGYNADQCQKILHNTHFKSFMDGWINPFRFLKKYGLYKGQVYLNWMKKLISGTLIDEGPKHGFSGDATFKDFKDAGLPDLYIMACDLNMKNIQEFSYEKTPTVSIAEACRASMAIPAFFPAWKFTNDNPNNHVYVDGGTMDLFPINLFDEERFTGKVGAVNPNTMGLYLANLTDKVHDNHLDYWHILQWAKDLFESALNAQEFLFTSDSEQEARTVTIDDLGIPGTKFDLTDTQQTNLYNSGYEATKKWLEAWKPLEF